MLGKYLTKEGEAALALTDELMDFLRGDDFTASVNYSAEYSERYVQDITTLKLAITRFLSERRD